MAEITQPIPARLKNVAVGGHVAGVEDIYDDNKEKTQKQINAEVEQSLGSGGSVDSRIANAVNAEKQRAQEAEQSLDGKIATEKSRAEGVENSQAERISTLEAAVGTGGSVDERIAAEASAREAAVSAETTRATAAEESLRQLYNNLQQSQPIPVTELPATGEVGKIYRLAGESSYADYMYKEEDLTTPIKMAEYDNAIDDMPTAGSDNLVKSGGIFLQKSIITLAHITKVSVSLLLNNGEYGYAAGPNKIVYKDLNGNVHTYDLRIDTIYKYNDVNLISKDGISFDFHDNVLSVKNVNGVVSTTPGLYYSPTVNDIVLLCEGDDPVQIRKTAEEDTCLICNGNIYTISGMQLKVSYGDIVLQTLSGMPIDFSTINRMIKIPSGLRFKETNAYGRTFVVENDVYVSIPSGFVFRMTYSPSTSNFIVNSFSSNRLLDEIIIFSFAINNNEITCSLPEGMYTINGLNAIEVALLPAEVSQASLHVGGYMVTGDAVGQTATYRIVANNGWQFIKIRVKKGEIYSFSSNLIGGTTPKGLTLADENNEIYFVSEKVSNAAFKIEKDGWLVANCNLSSGRTSIIQHKGDGIDKTVLLSHITDAYVSESLQNGEYGYAITPNKIAYKNEYGEVISFDPVDYGDYLYIYDDVIFIIESNKLGFLQPQTINVKSVVGVPSQDVGCYYSPTVNQLVFNCEITEQSTSMRQIRSTVIPGNTIVDNGLKYISNGVSLDADDAGLPPMVKFNISDDLKDYTGESEDMPYDGHILLTRLYERMDALAALYPDNIEKVDAFEYLRAEMGEIGVTDYPAYANGVENDGEYEPTPRYRTFMYIFRNNNYLWGNNQVNMHKKVLLIGGTHGLEMASQVNCYHFLKLLCEGAAIDKNYFGLRNSCDFYIIPILNGYGLYHRLRVNGNGVDINRNFECYNGFEVSGEGTIYYTGPSAFSEFESKLVKCLTEKVNPYMCIDHHSYTLVQDEIAGKYQIFFGNIATPLVARVCYEVAVDASQCYQKHYPEDFGNSGNILLSHGANLTVRDTYTAQMMATWWAILKNIPYSVTCEVSHDVMYSNGVPIRAQTTWTATDKVYSLNEYFLRVTMLRMLETAFEKDFEV